MNSLFLLFCRNEKCLLRALPSHFLHVLCLSDRLFNQLSKVIKISIFIIFKSNKEIDFYLFFLCPFNIHKTFLSITVFAKREALSDSLISRMSLLNRKREALLSSSMMDANVFGLLEKEECQK